MDSRKCLNLLPPAMGFPLDATFTESRPPYFSLLTCSNLALNPSTEEGSASHSPNSGIDCPQSCFLCQEG